MAVTGFEYNKVLPHDNEIEVVVLGTIILDYKAFITVSTLLKPEHFYNEAHMLIYQASYNMLNRGVKEIDMLTVAHELKENGKLESVGGVYYIGQLTRKVGSSANIAYHAAIIKSLWVKRRLIEIFHTNMNLLYGEESGEDVINKISGELISIDNTSGNYHISNVVESNLDHINKIKSGEINKFGITTGLTVLDEIINGLQAPDLIIVAGRPGMGKTAFAMTLLSNICIDRGVCGAFFSLEMSASQLDFRLESMHSGINYQQLQSGKLGLYDERRYEAARKKIAATNVFIDDDPDTDPDSLRTKALKLKMQHDIKIIFVDYIQLIESRGKSFSRENEISKVTRRLKKLAKEIDVPIIALSQLNREVEKRSPPEPRLSDLRESGAIEQDADIIIFLYRPEYYGIDVIEKDGEVLSTFNSCVIDIAKHRNGSTGKVMLGFDKRIMKFGNKDEKEVIEDLF